MLPAVLVPAIVLACVLTTSPEPSRIATTPPAESTPPTEPGEAATPSPAEPAVEAEAPARARLIGRVLTFGQRDAIAGARIIPLDGADMVTAAEDGTFALDLAPGTHRFVIRATGFEDLESRVTLAKNQQLEFEYRMLPTIDGKRYRTIVRQRRDVALSSTTLREAEIREVPGTRGDPLRVVGSLPGVSQLAGFLPYVVVRGAAPGNTGYYMDGSRVPILFHVALGPSVIHPYFIDAVDFYPGGAPVRLGRYASGIIEARTRPARRDRVHGDVDLRLTDAGGLLEIPINRSYLANCKSKKKSRLDCKRGPGKGSLTFAGRYSYTGALLSLVQSSVRIRFWDYQARFDHARARISPRSPAGTSMTSDPSRPATPPASGSSRPRSCDSCSTASISGSGNDCGARAPPSMRWCSASIKPGSTSTAPTNGASRRASTSGCRSTTGSRSGSGSIRSSRCSASPSRCRASGM
jgi:TonB-dependent Receptor Plug Domain